MNSLCATKQIMHPADPFEAVVDEHYESLFRFSLSLTRAESDAWDLTQQTFYTWATKGHQLRDTGKTRTWLFTTLHRAFLSGRRRQSRFPHHDLDSAAGELDSLGSEPLDCSDSSQVLAALMQVDEVYRAAVGLYYLEDCPYKEIAGILEVPIGTVKSRIARGLQQLRHVLQIVEPATGSSGVRPDAHSSNPTNLEISSAGEFPPLEPDVYTPSC